MNYEKTELGIKLDEGYRQFPYLDTDGNVTIGIGDNLTDRLGIKTLEEAKKVYPDGISYEDAVKDMQNKVTKLIASLRINIPFFDTLDDVRQSILVNMAYNMGISHLIGFRKMLMDLKAKKYWMAASEMRDSLWYKQLPKRAERLATMMATGDWL